MTKICLFCSRIQVFWKLAACRIMILTVDRIKNGKNCSNGICLTSISSSFIYQTWYCSKILKLIILKIILNTYRITFIKMWNISFYLFPSRMAKIMNSLLILSVSPPPLRFRTSTNLVSKSSLPRVILLLTVDNFFNGLTVLWNL